MRRSTSPGRKCSRPTGTPSWRTSSSRMTRCGRSASRSSLVVEKPAGVSLPELVEVRAAADADGVPIAVLFVQRGGPTDRWLARAGRAVYESTQFIAGPPDRYLVNGSPWMVDLERAGGGCMVNLAPHFVDLFLQSSA